MKDNIVIGAGIVARCQELFDFALEGTDYADPSKQHLQKIFTLSKIRQHQLPRVWGAIEKYDEETRSLNRYPVRSCIKAAKDWIRRSIGLASE